MQQEARLAESREISASQLKRALILSRGYDRLRVEPDGSVSSLYTARSRRLAFGREQLATFRVQSGVLIPQRQKETRIRISPGSADFWSLDSPETSQSVTLLSARSTGYTRSFTLVNRTDSPSRFRIVALLDPTTMSFRREKDAPGEIGVNAFNRGDHVVMDDVGDTTGVRVIGFSPRPSSVYMTKDKQRALDLVGSVEMLDSVAGMSGAILIIAQWEVDLLPGAKTELRTSSLYHPSSLETALADLSSVNARTSEKESSTNGSVFRCSSPTLNFAFGWARASLDAIEGEGDILDRLSAGFGLQTVRPDFYEKEFEVHKSLQRKDGLLPHSQSDAAGPLETALFLLHACAYLGRKEDKKLTRRWYPSLRRAGKGLEALSRKGLISSGPLHPDGWRRRLGSGFPTGVLSEVNLVASRALADLARVAFGLGKGTDSAEFREASVKLTGALNASLRDAESGMLALNLDPSGRLHKELTMDQAVSLAYDPLDRNLASSLVHRLMDADFETGFGPRTVPNSNALYYSATYGDGQLGGYWTRAALSHALLAYASGYPSIGSLQLEKVAKLVSTESEKIGGVPGEFPFWIDADKRTVGSIGSDPVAASRFLEALLVGELGLQLGGKKTKMDPPGGSKVQWLLLHGLDLGTSGSLFVGRSSSRSFTVSSYPSLEAPDVKTYAHSDRLELQQPLEGLLFWDDLTVLVCVGNTTPNETSTKLSVPVRAKSLSRSLFVDLDEFNQETAAWRRLGRIRTLDRIELRAEVRPGSWKWFRIGQITS